MMSSFKTGKIANSMFLCVDVGVGVRLHMPTCTRAHGCLCVCVCVCVCMCVYMHMGVFLAHLCVYVLMCIRACVYVQCACMYINNRHVCLLCMVYFLEGKELLFPSLKLCLHCSQN